MQAAGTAQTTAPNWLGLNAPRYTSYPAAPHFHNGITPAQHQAWLKALPADEPVSLYLHIPYCRSLCLYCACHSLITTRESRMKDYVDALIREIRQLRSHLPGRLKVSHIHLGGGTPNSLAPAHWPLIMAALRETFDLSAVHEFAVELDPRMVTPDEVALFASMGVTRVSLGIQDFDPHIQDVIGRVQPFAMVEQVVAWLLAHNITRINFDLIYGLPEQTLASWQDTLAKSLQLKPSRFAVFSYAHVPWMKKHQNVFDKARMPNAEDKLALEECARTVLTQEGYEAVGMDHFVVPDDSMARAARSGTLHRNFQGYTDDAAETLIGLGLSSISQLPQGYVQNVPDEKRYLAAIEAGSLPTARGFAMTPSDILRRAIIEKLMASYEVDIGAVLRDHALPWSELADVWPTLQGRLDEGVATMEGLVLRVPRTPPMLVRYVATAFDAYYKPATARYSKVA